jgi:hypothetical protein
MKNKKAFVNIMIIFIIIAGLFLILYLAGSLGSLYILGYPNVPQYFPVLNEAGQQVVCDAADPYYAAYLSNPSGFKNSCYLADKITISCQEVDYGYVVPGYTYTDCGKKFSLVGPKGQTCLNSATNRISPEECTYSDNVRCPCSPSTGKQGYDSCPNGGSCIQHITTQPCEIGVEYAPGKVCGYVTGENDGGCATDPKRWGYQASISRSLDTNPKILSIEINTEDGQPSCPLLTKTGIATAPKPVDAAKPTSFWSSLIDFIKQSFARLFSLQIVGDGRIEPGTAATYTISLAAPYPIQNDYTKGVYEQRWCNTALADASGNILQEIGVESCQDEYKKAATFTMPAGNFNDYVVIAGMKETKQVWQSSAWTTVYSNKDIAQESLSVTSKVLIAPVDAAKPTSFWSSIWNFIKSIFGG